MNTLINSMTTHGLLIIIAMLLFYPILMGWIKGIYSVLVIIKRSVVNKWGRYLRARAGRKRRAK